MKAVFRISLLFIAVILLHFSCKKELSCGSCTDNNISAPNKPPLADAGRDTTILLPKDSVLLDGSASTDPDSSITAYKWSKLSGSSSFSIDSATEAKAVVKILTAGVYQFELTVTDNGGLTAKDTVQILVVNPLVNQPPVACAGCCSL